MARALDSVREALDTLRSLAAAAPAASLQGQDWAISNGDTGAAAAEDAIGALLFATVALARQLRVIPEEALRGRASRFADRFRALETRAREEGVDLHDLDMSEWRRRWDAAATLSNQG